MPLAPQRASPRIAAPASAITGGSTVPIVSSAPSRDIALSAPTSITLKNALWEF